MASPPRRGRRRTVRPGGTRIDKKYLHKLLLRNRIYLGELSHKGNWYPGVHPPSSTGLWGRVHAVLAKDGHARSVETKIRSRTDALLRGLLYAPRANGCTRPTRARTGASTTTTCPSRKPVRRTGQELRAPARAGDRGAVVAQIRTVLTSPETVASVVRPHPAQRGPDRRGQCHGDGDGTAQQRVGSTVPGRAPPHRQPDDRAHRPRPRGRGAGIKVKWREVGWNAPDREFAPDSIGAELLEVEA